MNHQFKGVGLLPNLLTTGTLFCGFYTVLMVWSGDYQSALIYLVIASLFDLFDGYLARVLAAQSEFGAYYDSLSDAVAFGVAPAMLIYHWLSKVSHIFPQAVATQLSTILPMLYLLCVIIRLARFNVTFNYHKLFFTGAPSPAAALAVGAVISLALDPIISVRDHMIVYHSVLIAMIVAIGMLMIGRLPFPSFKGIRLSKKTKPFIMVLVLIFAALAAQEIRWVLFAAWLYIFLVAAWLLLRALSKLLKVDGEPQEDDQTNNNPPT